MESNSGCAKLTDHGRLLNPLAIKPVRITHFCLHFLMRSHWGGRSHSTMSRFFFFRFLFHNYAPSFIAKCAQFQTCVASSLQNLIPIPHVELSACRNVIRTRYLLPFLRILLQRYRICVYASALGNKMAGPIQFSATLLHLSYG